MQGLEFYVVDTETTGLLVNHHEIIELSVVRCSNKTQLSRQIKALNPKNASYDALNITGKTIQDLYKGITKQEAMTDLENFLNEDGLTSAHRCIIAHQASFDRRFLHALWQQFGKSFPADLWLCSLALSKRHAEALGYKKAKLKLRLPNAIELFGLQKVGTLHNAKDDSMNTFTLWQYLMDSNVEYLDLIQRFPHNKKDEPKENLNDLLEEEDA